MSIPAARTNHSYANAAAITAIPPNNRQDGDAAFNAETGYGWHFNAASSASASAGVLVPDLGTGRWIADTTIRGDAAPAFQAVAAGAMVSGTLTISTGIVIADNSEVIPVLRGAVTGSTNFGSLRELVSSRVAGAAGVGTVVIEAVGADGAKDADAAIASGLVHVIILTPQV
jgi:hypothetical protein